MIKQSKATNEDAYARLILVQHWFEELNASADPLRIALAAAPSRNA